MESSVETYELTADLDSVPETQAPFLCEIWNWQGDTSVLPYKVRNLTLLPLQWVEVLSQTAGYEEVIDTKTLKSLYVSTPSFDPNAFFFLTYR